MKRRALLAALASVVGSAPLVGALLPARALPDAPPSRLRMTAPPGAEPLLIFCNQANARHNGGYIVSWRSKT